MEISIFTLNSIGFPLIIVGLIAAVRPQTYDMAKTYYRDVTCGLLKLSAEIIRDRFVRWSFLIRGRIIVAKSQVTLWELSRIYLEAMFSISSLLRVGTTFKSYYLRISQRLGVNFAQQELVSRKSRKRFGPEKTFDTLPTRLFFEASLFICCKGNKNYSNCKVSCLRTPSFWRYKENYVTRNAPEKFRDFRETGPRTVRCELFNASNNESASFSAQFPSGPRLPCEVSAWA